MKKRFLLWIMIVGLAMMCVACKGQVADKMVETGSETVSSTEVYEPIPLETESLQELDISQVSTDEMVALTAEELKFFNYTFFDRIYTETDICLMMSPMFLTSEYYTPLDIDLGMLFYDGIYNGIYGAEADIEIPEVTEEEKSMLEEKYDFELETDVERMSEEMMNVVLQAYTKLTLEETNKVGLDFYYLEEYKSYYNVASDCARPEVTVLRGWKNAEGTIVLEYSTDGFLGDVVRQVILHEEEGHYYFAANIRISELTEDEDIPEDEIIYGQ